MWSSSSYTDTGKVRKINEDAILDLNRQNVWMVADGMGGHAQGDYASQLVKRSLSNYLFSPLAGINRARLVQALDNCNTELVRKADRDQSGIIGCTVALLQSRQSSVLCMWSGDSRIYRLRGDTLKQLTTDHSQHTMVEDRNRLQYPDSVLHPSGMLTCAIGGDQILALEQCWYELHDGDTFLLCTDGLTKEVNDEEIRDALLQFSSGDKALSTLAKLYEDRGARDNIGMVWACQSTVSSGEY